MKKLAALTLLLLPLCAVAVDFPVTSNGQPLAEIVYEKGLQPTVTTAARELSHWLEYISGAKLAIREGTPDAAKPAIVLAVNPAFAQDDLAKIGSKDGYAVRVKDKHLYILGTKGKGVLNGVFRMLQKNTDIIWARGNEEFGTVATPNPTITFTQTDYIDIPVFSMRGWQNEPRAERADLWHIRQCAEWNSHMTINKKRRTDIFDDFFMFYAGHNLIRLHLPEKTYYDKHPEYYPLIDGKRVRPSTRGANLTQICYSNPDAKREITRNFLKCVAEHPEYNIYGICQEDNMDKCECAGCCADIKMPDGTVISRKKNPELFHSTQFFLWLNDIAREFKQRYPGKLIKTNGYFLTETPPACKLEDNILTSYAPIFRDSKHTINDTVNKTVLDNLHLWRKNTDKLMFREYYGLQRQFPRPMDAIAAEDLRTVHKAGFSMVYSEIVGDTYSPTWNGEISTDFNAPIFWCLTNVFWNPYQDIEELRTQFFTRVYGDAAKDMAEFYHAVEAAWLKSPGKSGWQDHPYFSWFNTFNTAPRLKSQLDECLKRAATRKMPANGRIMFERLCKAYADVVAHVDTGFKLAVPVIDQKPDFDPALKATPWTLATPITDLKKEFDLEAPPPEKSDIRVLADESNLYVAGWFADKYGFSSFAHPYTPRRDHWPSGNKLELCITADGKNIYQFVADFNGNLSDLKNRDFSWDSHADLQLARTSSSWSILMTIPLKDIGATLESPVALSFCRYIKDPKNVGRGTITWRFCISDNASTFIPVAFSRLKSTDKK